MRFLLCKVLRDVGPDDNPPVTNWYAGTTRDGPQWTQKREEAWDFGTRPTVESILERDYKLAGCVIVETR